MGEITALSAAICWAFTSFIFTFASRQVGSAVVNRSRLLLALFIMLILNLLLPGTTNPLDTSTDRWLWLGVSGILGLFLADALLFQSYALIGPRLPTLLMCIIPVISALLAWLFLNENLSIMEVVGINITMAGIAWVTLERNQKSNGFTRQQLLLGLVYGTLSSILNSIATILSKYGLSDHYSPITGQLIRIIVSAGAIWIYSELRGEIRQTAVIFSRRHSMGLILAGTVLGPVIGMTISLYSIQLIPVGIASTLMSLTPIIVLPMTRYLFGEKVSPRAIFGTAGAILGVAIIFLAT